jgi:hypothetical protein
LAMAVLQTSSSSSSSSLLLLLLLIPLSLRTEHRASTLPRHPRLLFQFLGSIRHLVGLLGWGISPAQGLYLQRTTQHNKERRRQTSMPRAGFEAAIPMLERPKTVLALDRSAIETGVLQTWTLWNHQDVHSISCHEKLLLNMKWRSTVF